MAIMKMSNYNNDKPISFWEFLGRYECVIPLIQRDYAQGRKGKEELRKRFFGKIISSVANADPLMMDFVYGCPSQDDNNIIYPLDGQQRLTTLWLLHWYLAFKSNASKINDDFWERMKKFTYQTRTSSREFCDRLCCSLKDLPDRKDDSGNIVKQDVVDVIQGQPWFSRRFKKDPTVQSMLRSLSDTKTNSGFEQLLTGLDYETMLQLLTSEDCPVKFYFRSSKGEGINNPDDLYVKMNARGKRLTHFENFKAELFSFKDKSGVELFRQDDGSDFIKRHENQFTNLFWTLRHKEDNIVDHIQFEFFNRMALCFIIVFRDIAGDEQPLFNHITKHHVFSSIDVYVSILNKTFKQLFIGVINGLLAISEKGEDINKLFNSPYSFTYLPKYESDREKGVYAVEENHTIYNITDISVKRLVLFYAASMFFYFFGKEKKKGSDLRFNIVHFKDWLIFARNMFNNSGIDTYQGSKNILTIFNRIGTDCLDIINFLASDDGKHIFVQGDLLKNQYEEEIQKAEKIQGCRNHKYPSNLETVIRNAESWEPFDGAIRFLFTNANGEFDWTDFETKKKNFDVIIELSKEYCNTNENARKLTPLALRKFISHIEVWEDIDCFWYNSSFDSWREILLRKPLLARVIHNFLITQLDEHELLNYKSNLLDPIQRDVQEELVRSNFLAQTTWAAFGFRRGSFMAVVWRSSAQWKRYLLGTPRNRLLSQGVKMGLIDTNVVENRMLGDGEHFWGEDIYFDIKSNTSKYIFWWHGSKDVYLCLRDGHHEYANKDNREAFAISVEYDSSYDEFERRLNELVRRAETDMCASEEL